MATSGWRGSSPAVAGTRCPTGILIGLGSVVVVVAAVAAAVLARGPLPRLAVVVVAIGGFAVLADDARATLTAAVVAWPVGNGFLVNRLGELSWHARIDPRFVAGLLTAVCLGSMVAGVRRRVATRRWWRPFTAMLSEPAARFEVTRPRRHDEIDQQSGGVTAELSRESRTV